MKLKVYLETTNIVELEVGNPDTEMELSSMVEFTEKEFSSEEAAKQMFQQIKQSLMANE